VTVSGQSRLDFFSDRLSLRTETIREPEPVSVNPIRPNQGINIDLLAPGCFGDRRMTWTIVAPFPTVPGLNGKKVRGLTPFRADLKRRFRVCSNQPARRAFALRGGLVYGFFYTRRGSNLLLDQWPPPDLNRKERHRSKPADRCCCQE